MVYNLDTLRRFHRLRIAEAGCLVLIIATTILWCAISRHQYFEPTALQQPSRHTQQDGRDINPNRRALPSYPDSIIKGQTLICAMEQSLDASPPAVAQSTWVTISDLVKYGWVLTTRTARRIPVSDDFESISGLNAAFGALGISLTPGDWRVAVAAHSKSSSNGIVQYPATKANYYALWNVVDEPALVAKFAYGPKYMAESKHIEIEGNSQLPPLQKWSDLIWLGWLKITSSDDGTATAAQLDRRSKLTHVFRFNIVNGDTLALIRRAHGKGIISDTKQMPPVWPGWKLRPDIDAEAFKSIMSAPNAYGIAFLLATHKGKKQFGARTIGQVNAFSCPYTIEREAPIMQMCLYLHVIAVPGDEVGPEL